MEASECVASTSAAVFRARAYADAVATTSYERASSRVFGSAGSVRGGERWTCHDGRVSGYRGGKQECCVDNNAKENQSIEVKIRHSGGWIKKK